MSEIVLGIFSEYRNSKEPSGLVIKFGEISLDSYKSRTLLKQIRSSGAFQFHNSTEMDDPIGGRNVLVDLIGDIAKTDRGMLTRDRDKFLKTIGSVVKKHQREISELLGRLEENM